LNAQSPIILSDQIQKNLLFQITILQATNAVKLYIYLKKTRIQYLKIKIINNLANSCPPNRCTNGQVCSIAGDSYDSFFCACRPGMSGSNCESSACDSIPCQNGGTCYLDGFGNPKCKCVPGFKGNRCQKDLCSPSPCENGGSGCGHNSAGYGCTTCPYPYGGAFCQRYGDFAAAGAPMLAYYPFSEKNKLIDETGNGYNLSSFNANPVNYPHMKDPLAFADEGASPDPGQPMNEALVLFGQDVISTSSQTITFGNDFSFSIAFSISKFYLTSTLVSFTPNDLSDVSSMSLNILYDFFFLFFSIFSISLTFFFFFFLFFILFKSIYFF